MASPAKHPEFYRDRYPRAEDLDALIWAWENLPDVQQNFHAPAYGEWGGWTVFSRAAAAQASIAPDRVQLAQRLLIENGIIVERERSRTHFTRPWCL